MPKRSRHLSNTTRFHYLVEGIGRARSMGWRRLDEPFAAIAPGYSARFPAPRLTRSALYRMLRSLKETEHDPGLNDRSTARELGRRSGESWGSRGQPLDLVHPV
jgi:hypothetical protein